MLGNVVVYRQFKGQTLMCNRPEKRVAITPHQQKMKARFLEAVAFAKQQVADPVSKALYQPGPDSKFTSAYAAALADYLKRPVIDHVDLSGYHGNEGDAIIIKASDVARTLIVFVSIFGANGTMIEQGEAALAISSDDYVFRATTRNVIAPGSNVRVNVRDRAGNEKSLTFEV